MVVFFCSLFSFFLLKMKKTEEKKVSLEAVAGCLSVLSWQTRP